MAKPKKCQHGVPIDEKYGCPMCDPTLFKKRPDPDICEHSVKSMG